MLQYLYNDKDCLFDADYDNDPFFENASIILCQAQIKREPNTMSNLFVLDIETHPDENQATLRLHDQQGQHLAAQQVRIGNDHAFEWAGLFNTHEHVERYANRLLPDKQHTLSEDQLIAQLGVFLGREVLGEAIFQHLYDGISQRTVLIRLPATADDRLAAAFARIPWEIARRDVNQEGALVKT